jgi:hypothetical protein
MLTINLIIDFLFLCDLILYFRTTFIHSKSGREVIEPKEIAISYLKGRFWIDLLATIPFDTFAGIFLASGDSSFLAIFSLLKLTRVLRLNRIIAIMNIDNEIKLSLKLAKLIFFCSMYLHCLACAWYYIAERSKNWMPPLDYVWVQTEFYDESRIFIYLSSLYHAILLLAGNDIGPRDEDQLIFVSVALVVGAIINANIIGELSVILYKVNKKSSDFQEKLDTANDAMRHLGLPELFQVEITGFLTYSKALLESQEELNAFLLMVSPSARQKIQHFMFSKSLKLNPVFEESDKMIDFVSTRLEPHIVLPEYVMVTQGEYGTSLYLISKGECMVYVTDHHGNSHEIRTLENGNLFGEVALVSDGTRTATVKTIQYSEIAELKKSDYETV